MFGFLKETLSEPSGRFASLSACAAVRPVLYASLQPDHSEFLLFMLFCFFSEGGQRYLASHPLTDFNSFSLQGGQLAPLASPSVQLNQLDHSRLRCAAVSRP
ncbi:MAG: hypothetical protein ACI4TG_05215 [Ruminococcus sp.]